ncbi:MAG: hypothetical protein H6726_20435 [Sandaracinaceae bacterium]|nr:hypothetical protein [Sandaracinaceae bacterium]
MSSCYSLGAERMWVSNGTAEVFARAFLECLSPTRTADGEAALGAALEELVEIDAPGMLGFFLDSEPYAHPPVLAVLERAIEDTLTRSADILERRQPPDGLLEFLQRLSPAYQAHWLANLLRLHAMVRRARGEPLERPTFVVSESLVALIEGELGA